jgi:prepilin-type N-terminal cleavage/methylation domain-containing protein
MEKDPGARSFYRKLTAGFTLLELMIVLVLVGITSGFVVGSWRKIHAKISARSSIENLLVAFHKARSDATAKERRSGIAIAEDTANRFDAAGSPRSGVRYLRFVDAAGAGTEGFLDDQDTVIQDWTPLKGKVFAYSGSSSGYSNGVASIVYHYDGSTDNDLRLTLGVADFKDSFRLNLLPATGLATLER